MKKTIWIILLILILNPFYAYGIDKDEFSKIDDQFIMDQFERMDMNELDETIKNINKQTEDYLPKIHLKELIFSMIKGERAFNLSDLFKNLLQYIFKEIMANSVLLGKLVVLSIICAVLHNLSTAFENDAVGKIAYTVCYLIVIALAIQSFSMATKIGIDAIDGMVSFMQALLPVMLTFLLSMGGVTSTALFQPIIVAAINIISTLMKDIVVPLIFFSAILTIVNHFSSKIHISKLASLLKEVCMVLIGLMLTIFTGIITIQGVAASTTDGVSIRTARFAVERFVPIVGGFISEAFDTIIGCSLVLKNAIGGVGLIILAIMVAMPVLKILSLIFVYKIATAFIEPITENRLTNCLHDMSSSMVLLLGTVLSVALMFFLAVTMIIISGNVTLMMR